MRKPSQIFRSVLAAAALLAACSDAVEPPSGNGALEILDAGLLYVEAAYDSARGAPVTEQVAPELLGDDVQSYTCTTTNWGTSEVRTLADRVALSQDENIFPGALIQGRAFQDGFFTPITIPRGAGTIYMTGLALAPNAQYFRDLSSFSASRVNQAIAEILTTEQVQGTTAEASFSVVQTYSDEHMFFSLGVDARYGLGSMSTDLKMNNTTKKNYMLMKFTQKYFDIVFEDPSMATSVFADGAAFRDPEDQIGPGNPPLYISKVSYGRQVFFVAESEYNAFDVKAALEAAYNGAAEVNVEAGLDYGKVLSTTRMYYYVRGGSAGLALAGISQGATQAGMYGAILEFLANPEAANFSPSSPGAPIAYTVKYLSSRQTAQMSYNVIYDRKDCTAVIADAPKFVLHMDGIDDFAEVRLNGVLIPMGPGQNRFDGNFNGQVDISGHPQWNKDKDNKLVVKLFNDYCWEARINLGILVDNSSKYSDSHNVKWHWPDCYGVRRQYNFNLNPKSGSVSVNNNIT